jgi:hypothetical protein
MANSQLPWLEAITVRSPLQRVSFASGVWVGQKTMPVPCALSGKTPQAILTVPDIHRAF